MSWFLFFLLDFSKDFSHIKEKESGVNMGEVQVMWLTLIILTAVLEFATAGLVSIWFSCGGVLSLLLSFLGAEEAAQIVAFIAASLVSMLAVQPITKYFVMQSQTNYIAFPKIQIVYPLAMVSFLKETTSQWANWCFRKSIIFDKRLKLCAYSAKKL